MIGYVQYFAHLPAGLVWVHVANAALIWIAVIRLYFALRDAARWAGSAARHRCARPFRMPMR